MDSITIPFCGEELLEHEALLLRCWRKRDYVLLASLSCAEEEEEDSYETSPITGRPTVRLPKC